MSHIRDGVHLSISMRPTRANVSCALLAWAAAAAMAGPSGARAETLAVLAVAPPPGPRAELVEATLQLRQIVAEYRAGTLGTRETRERMTGAPPAAALGELHRACDAARVAYLAGQYERSLGMLRSIADDVEKLPDGKDSFALWTKVMIRLARTELDLGRTEAARPWIDRLVRAAPDLAFDPSLHPARLVDEVEKARAALKRAPTGTLAVTSSAAGARVYVNGREVGVAPVRLVVPRGRYRISGATQGATVGPIVAEVRSGEAAVVLDFTIPEALRPLLGPGLALAFGDGKIVTAAGHLGLDRILAVGMTEESGASYVVGSLYDVRRGALEREGRVRLTNGMFPDGGASALAEFLVTGRVASALVEVPGGPSATPLERIASGTPPRVEPPRIPAAAPADASRGWASLGLRLGYAKGLGNVAYHTNMDEWISAQVPVQLDVLVRVSRKMSVGAYGAWGFGRGGGDVSSICGRPGASCILTIVRAGIQAEYEFTPGATAPWIAFGLGYEWSFFHTENGTNAGTVEVVYRGFEVLNVQGGADWKMAPHFSLGPFVMMSAGRYERGTVKGTGASGSGIGMDGDLPDKSSHTWAQVGLRGRFDL